MMYVIHHTSYIRVRRGSARDLKPAFSLYIRGQRAASGSRPVEVLVAKLPRTLAKILVQKCAISEITARVPSPESAFFR